MKKQKTTKPKHGGARPGSGAKKKEPTRTLSYRVRVAIANDVDKAIREIISSMSKN